MEGLTLITVLKSSGGLGLFLLGMIVMTDGLRDLAGDRMKTVLMRFTKSPLSGAATGAVVTAILQSSSATTVATVGFVGAGLIAFPEALGIIFGANIGTTITGWMVALLGFKLNIGTIALPLILMGALFKIFSKDKLASFGYALAGFGLIFVGISFLQEGMSGFEGIISPENLPPDTWIGRIKLLILGIIVTLVTQSSSAGVATTLTALFAHAINFEQAVVLIIGMDVGTTATALMASVGGSLSAQRTGVSHVVYNLFTALMALFLITPYIYVWESIAPNMLYKNAEIGLVAFHTLFNILGVILVLPFTYRFSDLMEKIIPEKELKFTEKLDSRLLNEPDLALEAARLSTQNALIGLLEHINFILGDIDNGKKADLVALQTALDNTQNYVDKIDLKEQNNPQWQKLIALIHILDHEQRIHERCQEDGYRARYVQKYSDLHIEKEFMTDKNNKIIHALSSSQYTKARIYAKKSKKNIQKFMEQYRKVVSQEIAEDKVTMYEGREKLEAIRWLVRVSYHIERIALHMEEAIFKTVK